MKLSDTIQGMQSEDWKERLKAEYYQTKIRYDGIDCTIAEFEDGKRPELVESIELMKSQANAMANYLFCMKSRLALAGVEIVDTKEV